LNSHIQTLPPAKASRSLLYGRVFAAGFTITDAEWRCVLIGRGVADYGERVEEQRIRDFYQTYPNRRVEAQELSR
jgi:hypothetical protein